MIAASLEEACGSKFADSVVLLNPSDEKVQTSFAQTAATLKRTEMTQFFVVRSETQGGNAVMFCANRAVDPERKLVLNESMTAEHVQVEIAKMLSLRQRLTEITQESASRMFRYNMSAILVFVPEGADAEQLAVVDQLHRRVKVLSPLSLIQGRTRFRCTWCIRKAS